MKYLEIIRKYGQYLTQQEESRRNELHYCHSKYSKSSDTNVRLDMIDSQLRTLIRRNIENMKKFHVDVGASGSKAESSASGLLTSVFSDFQKFIESAVLTLQKIGKETQLVASDMNRLKTF
jgi:hypothetical protein